MATEGRFNKSIAIVDGKIEPKGPLELEPGEEFSRLDVWVVQTRADGTGATFSGIQEGVGFSSGTEWTTRSPASQYGEFKPGQALAMAMLATTVVDPSSPSIYGALGSPPAQSVRTSWWSEVILLTSGTPGTP